jgi:hypothetical protein
MGFVCVLELVVVLPPLVTVLVPLIVVLVPLIVVLVPPIFVTLELELVCALELLVVAAKLEPPFSALADANIALAALPVAVNLLAPLMRVCSAEAMSAFRALAIGCVDIK